MFKSRGFTLIEVLISMVILAIGLYNQSYFNERKWYEANNRQ